MPVPLSGENHPIGGGAVAGPSVPWEAAGSAGETMGVDGDRFLEELCTRRLDHAPFPRLYVDATYVKSRRDGDVSFQAIVAATGARADGGLEILGIDVGDSEDQEFWRRFLFSLRVRGLRGVRQLGSDRHGGLVEALQDVFPRAAWSHAPAHGDASPLPDGMAEPRAILSRVVTRRVRATGLDGAELVRALSAPGRPHRTVS